MFHETRTIRLRKSAVNNEILLWAGVYLLRLLFRLLSDIDVISVVAKNVNRICLAAWRNLEDISNSVAITRMVASRNKWRDSR